MNILARFGLSVDPKPAADGARAIIKSLGGVKKAIQDVAATPEPTKGLEAAGKAGKRAGDDIAGGMGKAKSATREAGDAARGAGGAFDGLVGKLMKFVAAIGLAVVAWKGLSMAGSFVMESIASASQMEGFQSRWAFLLGSFDAARAKMSELQAFANKTPFDLPGVTTAALALAKLKDTGLEAMEGLRMVGDAAGVAGQPIEEVASRIARLVNNLKRGGGSGDEARILGEWQIFSPELVGRLADMGTEAGNFKVLLGDIKKELAGASGGMLLMSTTWDGMVSTMKDAWNTLKTAIGEPLIQGFKPLLADITALIDRMTERVKGMQPQIQQFAAQVTAAFRTITADGGLKLGLKAAWDYFSDIMRRTWEATGTYLAALFKKVAYEFKTAISDPAFWQTVADNFLSAMTRAVEALAPQLSGLMGILADPTGSKMDKQQDIELNRLKETQRINQELIRLRAADPSKTFTPADVPAASDGTYGADLPGYGSPGKPLIDGGPPPEPVWNMGEAVETPAMKEFRGNWLFNLDNVLSEIIANTQAADDLVKKKKEERDAAEALAGGPNGSLFPDTGSGETRKEKPLLEETGMTWDDTKAAAEKYKEDIKTPEQKLAEEKALLDGMVRLNQLSEEQKTLAVKKAEGEYVASQQAKAEAAKQAIQAEETALQKLLKSWGDLKNQMDQAAVGIMQSIEGNITGAITSMIDGTKSASQAFSDMAKGIVNSILQIITKLIVQYALYTAMGMATGGFSAMATSAISSSVKHEGGEVGGGRSRSVSSEAFAGAMRFHQGGMIGSNEVPVIAEKGETILTKDQTADIKRRLSGEQEKAAAPQVTIANYTNPEEMKAALASDPSVILNMISIHAPQVRRILGQSGGS